MLHNNWAEFTLVTIAHYLHTSSFASKATINTIYADKLDRAEREINPAKETIGL